MLKMVDGTGNIGVDMVCPLGGTVSPPQPPNYDKVEMEGVGSLMLPNSLKAPLERVELIGNSVQGENPAPDNPQEIKSAGKWNEEKQKYEIDVKVTGKNLFDESNVKKGYITVNDTIQNATELRDEVYSDYIPVVYKSVLMTLQANIPQSEQLWSAIAFYTDDKTFIKRVAYNGLTGKSELKTKVEMMENARFIRVTYRRYGNGKMMINSGEIYLSYEPYTEQFAKIVLDEPLRGIGKYKDMLTKDGVVRKIYPPYEINLNDLRDGGYSRTNTVMFSVKVQNKTVGYAGLKPSILCNILPDCGLQTGNIYNDDKECIAVGGAIVLFRVNKSRLKDISSFEATKQSFIELMADKKMIVEYALETPVTEPLPESVQQQLQALHSENGVTHVFVDSGEVSCGIKLTYRKEK